MFTLTWLRNFVFVYYFTKALSNSTSWFLYISQSCPLLYPRLLPKHTTSAKSLQNAEIALCMRLILNVLNRWNYRFQRFCVLVWMAESASVDTYFATFLAKWEWKHLQTLMWMGLWFPNLFPAAFRWWGTRVHPFPHHSRSAHFRITWSEMHHSQKTAVRGSLGIISLPLSY